MSNRLLSGIFCNLDTVCKEKGRMILSLFIGIAESPLSPVPLSARKRKVST